MEKEKTKRYLIIIGSCRKENSDFAALYLTEGII